MRHSLASAQNTLRRQVIIPPVSRCGTLLCYLCSRKKRTDMQKEKDTIGQLRKRLQDCEALILRLAKSFLLDEIFVG